MLSIQEINTRNELKGLIKKIHYYRIQLAKENHINPKEDARKKIMLGGLFVKAGLDHFHPHDPATLYGMLLDATSALNAKPKLATKWQKLGKELLQK